MRESEQVINWTNSIQTKKSLYYQIKIKRLTEIFDVVVEAGLHHDLRARDVDLSGEVVEGRKVRRSREAEAGAVDHAASAARGQGRGHLIEVADVALWLKSFFI